MNELKTGVRWLLLLAIVAVAAVGATVSPSSAADAQAVAAPCPISDTASCAYDPETGWRYRTEKPVAE